MLFKNDDTEPRRSLGDLLFFFLIMWPILVVAHGAIGKLFWLWFVVSPFSAPEITVAQAAGLGVVVTFFGGSATLERRHKPEEFTSLAAYGIYQLLILGLVLVLGGVVKLWLDWS